ncbi:hypothetical protein DFJ73DRAFT_142450 [Zopfochytrium polystomum]|nr:hypothetical protein DFJ73DRAFT_142450 [Zopfochytrium polystomum]
MAQFPSSHTSSWHMNTNNSTTGKGGRGDHSGGGSLEGLIRSGRRLAEAFLASFSPPAPSSAASVSLIDGLYEKSLPRTPPLASPVGPLVDQGHRESVNSIVRAACLATVTPPERHPENIFCGMGCAFIAVVSPSVGSRWLYQANNAVSDYLKGD